MAPAQVASSAPAVLISTSPTLQPSQYPQHAKDDPIRTVDDLVRHRARTIPHTTIVSYPTSSINFVDYTMQQLDVFAFRVAKSYQAYIPTRKSSDEKPTTVAILGPSNLDYLVTMLALTKLGHTVLFLSTRISQLAVESLIESTGATFLLTDPKFSQLAETVKTNLPTLTSGQIASSGVYNFEIEVHADTRLDYQLDHEIESSNIIYIIHSSGSTGLPKPIYQPQKSTIANYAMHMDMKAFITLPLYHNHGICNFFRAIYSGKSIHIYNADLPLTQSFLTSILREHHFEIFYGVPYALKLLAETDEGIALLRQLQIVMYGGSACPDTLGNELVDRGVNLVGHYGATEVGQLMTSFRPVGDKDWNYVREGPKLSPYLRWVSRGTNLFECTVLPGWPSKVASNQPDGSYATKDLFEPHPTIEKAWKYIARADDTIALVNGEKFNPVMMEGTIRSHQAVAEAVMYGSGRPYLGLLVVPSSNVAGFSQSEIVAEIWPVIEKANQTAESYAKLSRDMIRVLPHGCEYPRTDKGSVIRQAFYKAFSSEIEQAYDEAAASGGDLKSFTITELEEFLRDVVAKSLPEIGEIEKTTNFFAVGLDSLQAIQIRNAILKSISIRGKNLGQNVVFDYPSIMSLASHLYQLRTGQLEQSSSPLSKMQELINKYSTFSVREKASVVLTGATGSLGAHVLVQLLQRPDVATVYCLVRARDAEDAATRVKQSLIQRRVYHGLPLSARRRIHALPSDLSDQRLGLGRETFDRIARNLSSVIHCAWSVNFNWNLSTFEKDCISGVRNLIDLCLADSSAPASFNFCSSVSTVAQCPDLHTPEDVAELAWAQNMGYAQSKCVSENICVAAAKQTGMKARVLRVGQIVADTVHGVWNDTEAIPLILQSAQTIGALPKLRESPSWTPVDVIAQAVSEISLSDAGSCVANVTNARTFSWTEQLLPALHEAGLVFDEVEPKEWVARLAISNDDPLVNPPKKLLEFFKSKYDKEEFSPSRTYETKTATSFSPSLATAPVLDAAFVKTFIHSFQNGPWKKSSALPSGSLKNVIILTGPCGSGKSTIARQLSSVANATYIEGDGLHDKAAIASMAAGLALTDDVRIAWLNRIKMQVLSASESPDCDQVFVACSSLKHVFRDQLREIATVNEGVRVRFVDLQVSKEELVRRMAAREGHYMKVDMVEGQVAIKEGASASETDVLPVDAERSVEEIVAEINTLL